MVVTNENSIYNESKENENMKEWGEKRRQCFRLLKEAAGSHVDKKTEQKENMLHSGNKLIIGK